MEQLAVPLDALKSFARQAVYLYTTEYSTVMNSWLRDEGDEEELEPGAKSWTDADRDFARAHIPLLDYAIWKGSTTAGDEQFRGSDGSNNTKADFPKWVWRGASREPREVLMRMGQEEERLVFANKNRMYQPNFLSTSAGFDGVKLNKIVFHLKTGGGSDDVSPLALEVGALGHKKFRFQKEWIFERGCTILVEEVISDKNRIRSYIKDAHSEEQSIGKQTSLKLKAVETLVIGKIVR